MYSTQIIKEATQGKFNISHWVKEEIDTIQQSDIDSALERAELFLTKDRDNLESKARVEEIALLYPLEDAKQLIVDTLLSTIILIKPTMVIRRGISVGLPGVAPIQAIATQIGLALHHDQLDAVQTGIEILAEFADIGIYDVRIVEEANRAVNRGGQIEVHGDSAVIIPALHVSVDLYHRIQHTQYLPPMLVKPLEY